MKQFWTEIGYSPRLTCQFKNFVTFRGKSCANLTCAQSRLNICTYAGESHHMPASLTVSYRGWRNKFLPLSTSYVDNSPHCSVKRRCFAMQISPRLAHYEIPEVSTHPSWVLSHLKKTTYARAHIRQVLGSLQFKDALSWCRDSVFQKSTYPPAFRGGEFSKMKDAAAQRLTTKQNEVPLEG